MHKKFGVCLCRREKKKCNLPSFVLKLSDNRSAVFMLSSSVSVAPFHDEFVIYEQNMEGT